MWAIRDASPARTGSAWTGTPAELADVRASLAPNGALQRSLTSMNAGPERVSLASLAFGAVSGTVLGILIRPILDLLPARLFEEFVSRVVEAAVTIGLAVGGAFVASRIGRLDHFLRRYLAGAAVIASLALAASLWARAGMPRGGSAVAALAATSGESWLFLMFCGGAVTLGLFQITGGQARQYEEAREADARRISEEAIAEGDPALAAGIFGSNAAGAVGQALAMGCARLVGVTFHLLAVWAVTALDAHVLFELSWVWSALAGGILAAASMLTVMSSAEFGERYSSTVPLDEKYRGILPDR